MDGSEPNGPTCDWCGEPILGTEPKRSLEYFCGAKETLHFECQARMIVGSVAHIEQRCGCFVKGASEGDSPTMTKREAALASLKAFERRHTKPA